MSSKLPNELLIKILLQLHQDDQMECMLVCHDWNQIIADSVLYRTVFIYSVASMKKLLDKLQQRSDIANRIERVMVDINFEEQVNGDTFLSLLVNLKTLHCSTIDFPLTTQYAWHKQIEYISETSDPTSSEYFLTSNVCPNLTTLVVGDTAYQKFPNLKNAPNLTSLTLVSPAFYLDYFEEIHESLPRLKSLNILYLTYFGGFKSEDTITPAASVTEFELIIHTWSLELLMYIYKKYPNLTKLTYNTNGLAPDDISDTTRDQIDKGWTLLLQTLGPQLKKICINSEIYHENFFETLDRFSCKLNYLNIGDLSEDMFAKMIKSQQIFYIQTLVLEEATCQSFNWLKDFHMLKNLELVYDPYSKLFDDIKMNDIISNSPSKLESLSIQGTTLNINLDYTGTSNIKILSFNNVHFDDRVDDYISLHFPQLSKLELSDCNLQGSTFNLGTMDLLSFHYHEQDFFEDSNITLIETLWNNEQRFYYYNDYNLKARGYASLDIFYPQNYLPIKSCPASEMSDTVPNFTLVCNSVRSLIIT